MANEQKQDSAEFKKRMLQSACTRNVDLTRMPQGDFEKVVRILVNSDEWLEMQMKRNKVFRALKQATANRNPNGMTALMKQMEAVDAKMAKTIYLNLFNFLYGVSGGGNSNLVSLDEFERKFLDTEEKRKSYEKYRQCSQKAFFLLDIVDSYVTDALGALDGVLKEEHVKTTEFDDIREVCKVVKSHNLMARKFQHQQISDLENGFIDSIQEFVDGQMDAYLPSLEMLKAELKAKGEIKDGYSGIDKNKLLDR